MPCNQRGSHPRLPRQDGWHTHCLYEGILAVPLLPTLFLSPLTKVEPRVDVSQTPHPVLNLDRPLA